MPFETICVKKWVFNTDLPVSSCNCNGHISRDMPLTSEESGTSVLGFPLCRISFWNTDICLVLKFCPGLMLESKSHLPLSLCYLSLSFFLSASLSPLHLSSLFLKSPWPKLTCVYPGCNISERISVQAFTQHFPLSSDTLSSIKSVAQKEILYSIRDIPICSFCT